MIVKYILPALALVALVFAVQQVMQTRKELPAPPPPMQPAKSPFKDRLAGTGMIEARTENINIGSPVAGIVTNVFVKVGQKVDVGAPLFKLDDRQLIAEKEVRQAAVFAAQAEYDRLKAQPRAEQLPPLQAQVEEMEASLSDMKDQLKRTQELYQKRVAAEEQFIRIQMAVQMAEARLHKTKGDLELLQAGAWKHDLLVTEAALKKALALVDQTDTEIMRLTVNALVAGEVLQVNVRPGEYVGAAFGQALIILGNVEQLHVRVDIDEHDIPRFLPDTKAQGSLKGRQENTFALKFVRVEPYVIPKKSLTGQNTERVDTRVLQVIYAVEPTAQRLFVGQQVDVFIEAGAEAAAGGDEAKK